MLLPMSEYSGIPDILYPSWDSPRMGCICYSLCRSIRGFLILCIHPGIVLGWGGHHMLLPMSEYSGIPDNTISIPG